MSSTDLLKGRRVLVVEDRYLIALEMSEAVARMGGEAVGPWPDVRRACECVAAEKLDLALLDINLDGELSYPVAEALASRGVPFIFLTGYDDWVLPEPWRDRPQLRKPVNIRALEQQVKRALL